MSYPILYAKNATNFFNLGLGVLSETRKCIIREERNGIFELIMEYPISGTLFTIIENDLILKCDAGHALKEQLFRIKKITKTSDKTAEIYAQHVSYLTQDLVLRPEVTFRGSAYNALVEWKGSIIDSNPFEVNSDILTENATTLTVKECENARRALGGVSGSILDTWGGEYKFDNYRISLLSARGGSANTLIAYGRNLTDLNQEDNIESTYTSLMPFAVYTPDEGEEKIITIDGYVIDSEHLNKFPNRRILTIDLSDKFGEDEEPTPVRLRTMAEQYIKANNVGVPKVSLKVSFIDLTKTLNFTGSNYEELNLCDTVPIYFEQLDIKTRAKIVKIEWNVLLDRYESLELGDTRPNLSDKLNQIENNIDETNRNLNSGLNHALISANGRNTVFYGPNEPKANRVGDLWYKPNGEETELYIWNGSAWEFIMSTAPDQVLLDAIEDARKESEEALKRADEAYDSAETARQDAQGAFDFASGVAGDVNGLRIDMGNFNEYVNLLDGRVSTAETNITNNSYNINLHASTLTSLDGRMTSAESGINVNASNITLHSQQITNVDGRLTGAEANIVINANSISSAVYEINGLRTDITTVTQLANGLQTQVTKLDGDLITTKSQVTQLSNQFNIMVQDLSDLDNVVSSNYTQLTNAINLRVQKNDIINQINISTEGILIAGEKIHITGKTYIDNAVITSAMIASINADKITTGTLNAANVNIINLDVSNLTGNRTNFVQSYWNSINSQVQIDYSGLKIVNDGTLRASLNKDGLYIYHPWGSPAGALRWSQGNFDSPSGVDLRAATDSFIALGHVFPGGDIINSQSRRTLEVHGQPVVINGNSYNMMIGGGYLSNSINANGYGINGPCSFYLPGDVEIYNYNTEKVLRPAFLGTVNFTNNRRIKLEAWEINGEGGFGFISPNSNSGIFMGEGGGLYYLKHGAWYSF